MKAILCNTEVVKNIMAGRQVQDRRPLKVQPEFHNTTSHADENYWGWSWKKNEKDWFSGVTKSQMLGDKGLLFPGRLKRQPGDILYVRETFMLYNHMGTYNGKCPKEAPRDLSVGYKSDGLDEKNLFNWRPSIHMPKWATRTFLKVKRVWVERVQDISCEDIMAEGVTTLTELNAMLSKDSKTPFHVQNKVRAKKIFKDLWNSIYPGSWERNEWVECCEFELIDKTEGE